MLSRKTRYALKALIYLAGFDGKKPLPVGTIAQETTVPQKFLETIFVELKQAGIVQSVRGLRGGYLLARSPDAISFAEVIRLLEGPIALAPCASRTAYGRCDGCADENNCALRRVLIEARNQIADLLEFTSLADAVLEEESAVPFLSLG